MKIANVNGRAFLIAEKSESGDTRTVYDVESASGSRFGPTMQNLYRDWDEFRAWAAGPTSPLAEGNNTAGEGHPRNADLGAVSPTAGQVFAVGLNYAKHAAEGGRAVPTVPAVFTKFQSCLSAPFAEVPHVAGRHDYEAELVVVIGRTAHNVGADNAWDYVAGLTIGQDFSERVTQNASGGHFSLGKSFPNFGPTGPWLVTPDEFANPDDLQITCKVNDETRQNERTSSMVFNVASLIEHISHIVTLNPGDIIFTGTPDGVGNAMKPDGLLHQGDIVETTIEGIGTIRQSIV